MVYLKEKGGVMRSGNCFTIVEVVIAIILVAILAGIGIPSYYKAVEKNTGRSAVMNLQVIYNAEKVYKLDNDEYYTCVACDIDDINTYLETFINDPNFVYTITAADRNGDGEEDGFVAKAVRQKGVCAGKTITINERGGDPAKGCTLW